MAPFLRDEGPPVSSQTLQRARESLPLDFGFQSVNEKGREVLVVRVPKARPDYLHDLAEVAFYVGLDQIRNTKDILLVGHEKTARLEPQLLRDHIRAQAREDVGVVDHLRRQIPREYGFTVVQSPSNHSHQALAMRIPKESVATFSPEDVRVLREALQGMKSRLDQCQYAYIVAERDYERLGRRVLLELLGLTPGATPPPAAGPAPLPVAAPTPAAPAAPATRTAFPASPGSVAHAPAPLPTAFPSMAPPAPPPINSIARPQIQAPPAAVVAAPTPPPAPVVAEAVPVVAATPAAAPAPQVEETEEYEIVSKPKPAAPAARPAPAPLGLVPSEGAEVEAHDEYEIVSKPKAPVPAARPAAAPLGLAASPDFDSKATSEYEVVTRKAPPAAPVAAALQTSAAAQDDERKVERMNSEFEVYTSKPKAPAAPVAPAPRLPQQQPPPAPSRTKEYEIMSRPSVSAAPPSTVGALAARLHLPSTEAVAHPHAAPASHALPPPRDDPRNLPTRTAFPVPEADSGAATIPVVVPANPEMVLAQRFKEGGYEIVEGLRAQGTVFAFAAHKPQGRRVLVKRAQDFGPEDAATLSQLVTALGADVGLVVADKVLAGTRIATWGTRIEVVASADVQGLAL